MLQIVNVTKAKQESLLYQQFVAIASSSFHIWAVKIYIILKFNYENNRWMYSISSIFAEDAPWWHHRQHSFRLVKIWCYSNNDHFDYINKDANYEKDALPSIFLNYRVIIKKSVQIIVTRKRKVSSDYAQINNYY